MANTSSSSSSGIGFVGLLTVAFIVLKLTGYIDWSWWWVLSPMWISAILGVAIVVIVVTVLLLARYGVPRVIKQPIMRPLAYILGWELCVECGSRANPNIRPGREGRLCSIKCGMRGLLK